MAKSGEGIIRRHIEIEDILPVTPIHLAILAHQSIDRYSNQVVQYIVTLEGAPRLDLLESALQRLIRERQILRSMFLFRGMTRPVQVVLQKVSSAINVEREHMFMDWLRKDRETGILPDREPLLRCSLFTLDKTKCALVWTFHPLAIDDWSFQLLHFDFWRYYSSSLSFTPMYSIGVSSNKNYVRFLQRQDAGFGRRFWREYLNNFKVVGTFPGRSDSALPGISNWGEHTISVPGELSKAIIECAKDCHVSTEAFLLVLWGILVRRYSGAEDVLFGAKISGRSAPVSGIMRMAGAFANIVPVRVNAGEESPLRVVAAELEERLRHIHHFGHIPLEEIQAVSGMGNRLLNHTMTVMNERNGLSRPAIMPPDLDVMDIEKWDASHRNAFDLHCEIVLLESVTLTISYRTSLFKHPAIEKITNDFLHVIRQATEFPNSNVCDLVSEISTKGDEPQSGLVDRLKSSLMSSLPPYMIPSRFVVMGKLPLGPSGKVNRQLLPDPAGSNPSEEAAPLHGETERMLQAIWAEILSIPSVEIGLESDFFDLGGHSLRAVRLSNAIEKSFSVRMEIQTIFRNPTIPALAKEIAAMKPAIINSIQPLGPQPYYGLSYAQQRIWILNQLNPGSSAFNMPVVTPVTGQPLQRNIVERVLKALVKRHEAFRTYFVEKGQQVVQVIEDSVELPLRYIDLSALDEAEKRARREQALQQESVRPFDLLRPPLFRALMIKSAEDHHHLLFNMHHIVSDGWSLQVLQREFQLLYDGEKRGIGAPLQELPLQYKDYAHWHNQQLDDDQLAGAAHSFWRRQLEGALPPLDLPYDFPKTKDRQSSGSGFRTFIPGDVYLGLKTIGQGNRASIFMVLLAAFNMTLFSLRNQDDIIIGIAGAARQHDDLKNVIGLFVNTLILRTGIQRDESFLNFLSRVRENALKVLEYQSYPMELACQRLGIQYPELTVFFNMLNLGDGDKPDMIDEDDFHIPATQDNKFPMTFYVSEFANGIEILCTYLSELFRPLTIEKIVLQYRKTLTNVAKNPDKKIGEYGKSGKKKSLKRKIGASKKGHRSVGHV